MSFRVGVPFFLTHCMAMQDKIKINFLPLLPNAIQHNVEQAIAGLNELLRDQNEMVDEDRADQFVTALASSRFICEQQKKHPETVLQGLAEGVEQQKYNADQYALELSRSIDIKSSEAEVMKGLRRQRNKHMMLIAWRDLSGADVSSILQSLSDLADAMIRFAVDWAYHHTCNKWGVPTDEVGREQKLMVIAMGKLGAQELNFSSDIDLIFCYPSSGDTDGARSISNEEFFTRLCQVVVRILDKRTVDGFVFRVDTRLRPFGASGALVLNSDAMENYYQSQAREWERYAMVKARVITGESNDISSLMSMLRAFVYRRYLDYGIFDSIRVMKRQIESQLQQKGIQSNVKLGPGGIREIEFIGQAFQLIRGGRDKPLQARGILKVLALLAERGQIPALAAEELTQDYIYLRRLENRLQEIDDKQTHELPQDEINQHRLLIAMQADDWPSLLQKTQTVMARVHGYFASLVDFSTPDQQSDQPNWMDLDEAALSQYLLTKQLNLSEEASRLLLEFCHSYAVRRLEQKGREYLARLMPILLDALLLAETDEKTLLDFLTMLEKICNRTVYLVLLVENKLVFDQLLRLSKLSPWIVSQVTRSPILLDELIDPASLYHPATKQQLQSELDITLNEIDATDVETQMEALRLFKQANVLRVAAADLTGVIPLMVVSDKLTEIAEVIIAKALSLSWRSVCATYGAPPEANAEEESGFCVIGFGKLGGIELGFGSDLDLVLMHQDAPIDATTCGDKSISLAEFYTRLGRKLISLLTTRTFSGPLYEVDLRLRPNGNSGLLVSSETAFKNYQQNQAWTWEHQALIRARFIAGCPHTKAVFEHTRQAALAKPRQLADLKKDIIEMREKMRSALLKTEAGCFDLKHGHGGIVDIEFIVQFGVLAKASQFAALLTYTDNIRLLLELNNIGFLSNQQQQALSNAYKTYREATHHAALAETSTMIDAHLVEPHIGSVSSIWEDIILTN